MEIGMGIGENQCNPCRGVKCAYFTAITTKGKVRKMQLRNICSTQFEKSREIEGFCNNTTSLLTKWIYGYVTEWDQHAGRRSIRNNVRFGVSRRNDCWICIVYPVMRSSLEIEPAEDKASIGKVCEDDPHWIIFPLLYARNTFCWSSADAI